MNTNFFTSSKSLTLPSAFPTLFLYDCQTKKEKEESVNGLEERKKPQIRAYTLSIIWKLFIINVFKEKDGAIEDMPRITL